MIFMSAGARKGLWGIGLVLGTALGLLGCDAGGLLVVDSKDPEKPPVKAHAANELVNGGTHASNGKYKVFYVVGQPTPLQGVATSSDQRVNGGLTGAVHGE
jgi:hypothetical protein